MQEQALKSASVGLLISLVALPCGFLKNDELRGPEVQPFLSVDSFEIDETSAEPFLNIPEMC